MLDNTEGEDGNAFGWKGLNLKVIIVLKAGLLHEDILESAVINLKNYIPKY